MSSGQSVSGVVVRGVPPEMDEAVVDLKAHLTSGSLERARRAFRGPSRGRRCGRRQGRASPTRPRSPASSSGRSSPSSSGSPSAIRSASCRRSARRRRSGTIPKVKRFVVAGTFDSGMYDYDSGAPLHGARRRAEVLRARDEVTGVEIRVDRLYNAERVARAHRAGARRPVPGARLDGGEPQPLPRLQAREGRLLHRADADRAGRRVQHRRDADHGGDGEAEGHRHPQVDGRDRPQHRAASSC